jgi:hypothetical protein
MIRQRVNAGLSAIKAKIKRDGHFTTKGGTALALHRSKRGYSGYSFTI